MHAGHRKIIYFMLASELLFIYSFIHSVSHSLSHLQGYDGGNVEDPCLLELMPAVLYKFKNVL